MNKKSWNPVLNKFVEIKKAFVSKYEEDTLFDYNSNEETCLEYWVRMLGIKEYEELIKPLQTTEYEGVILVRYANFESLFGGEVDRTFDDFWKAYDGFYMECRSVTIDIHNNELVTTPFRKFRNLNECEENSLENIREMIQKAKCVEFSNKLDGSMQAARWYQSEIFMTGSQALNPGNSWRLTDGYRMLKENNCYEAMLKENPHVTFIFEYISLEDAHVVKYEKEEEGLYLIGARDVNTGKEFSYKELHYYADKYSIPMTETFDVTLDEIVNNLDKKKSSEAEGFVLNIDGYKVKIKYDDYVLMHRLYSIISSPNVIIQSIADEKYDDLISKVPDTYKKRVETIAKAIFDYLNKTETDIAQYYKDAPKNDKKEFMLWVENNVPKELKYSVRCKYLGTEYNLLHPRPLQYKKLHELGINNVHELLKNSTDDKNFDTEEHELF